MIRKIIQMLYLGREITYLFLFSQVLLRNWITILDSDLHLSTKNRARLIVLIVCILLFQVRV